MTIEFSRRSLVGLLAALIAPVVAGAQGLETVGSRAAALGAFVAVADDASAIVWNPAGLVSGPIFNISVDLGRSSGHASEWPGDEQPAGRIATTFLGLGSLPVGVAYYRIAADSIEFSSPAVVGSPDRQDRHVLAQTLVTSHLGASVQQSVGSHLTVGATLKLVRGEIGAGNGTVSSWDAAFDIAERIDKKGFTRGDVDLGVMASAGRLRAGLVIRNVTEPTFGEESDAASATLQRHARLGVAWSDRWPGIARTIVAFDADITRIPQGDGERRDVAAGVERWMWRQRIGLRGGVRASTVGDSRPVVSGGGSFGVWAGLYVDAYVARGRGADQAWGVAARMSY